MWHEQEVRIFFFFWRWTRVFAAISYLCHLLRLAFIGKTVSDWLEAI